MNSILMQAQGLFSTAETYSRSSAMLEIIIMLLVAFVLGYLLRLLIGKNSKSDSSEWEMKYNKVSKELQKCKKMKAEEAVRAAAPSSSKGRTTGASYGSAVVDKVKKENKKRDKKNDLKKIEGIGPKIEQLLNAGSIYTWQQLTDSDTSYIQGILDKAGPGYKIHDPRSWAIQAKLAADGKWDELKMWQEEHKGGKL